MKLRKTIVTAICAVVITVITSGGSAEASSVTPGSAGDPLVTQSYVDEKYNALYNQIASQSLGAASSGGVMTSEQRNDIIAEVLTQIEQTYGSDGAEDMLYTPVFANNGQIILGGEGTEIILRSGTAAGYVQGLNGLSDITTGMDIMGSVPVSLNHLLIVPRDDGRGVRATSDAWFLIKGPYTIH